MEHYRHPDLHVRLQNPNEARIFLDDPRTWLPSKKPKFISPAPGRTIELDTQKMSDERAIEAAFFILEILVQQAMYEDPPFPPYRQ